RNLMEGRQRLAHAVDLLELPPDRRPALLELGDEGEYGRIDDRLVRDAGLADEQPVETRPHALAESDDPLSQPNAKVPSHVPSLTTAAPTWSIGLPGTSQCRCQHDIRPYPAAKGMMPGLRPPALPRHARTPSSASAVAAVRTGAAAGGSSQ